MPLNDFSHVEHRHIERRMRPGTEKTRQVRFRVEHRVAQEIPRGIELARGKRIFKRIILGERHEQRNEQQRQHGKQDCRDKRPLRRAQPPPLRRFQPRRPRDEPVSCSCRANENNENRRQMRRMRRSAKNSERQDAGHAKKKRTKRHTNCPGKTGLPCIVGPGHGSRQDQPGTGCQQNADGKHQERIERRVNHEM
ncbi:hypothetical protein [Hoeflea alexandrii]